MILQRLANRGLHLGELFEDAARRNPYQRITLDQPLSVAAELGTELTAYTCANLVAGLAAALRDAGVQPTEKVVLYKSDNFDIFLIACAVSRIGAIPVLLSPELTSNVVAQLISRCAHPHLMGDQQTLTALTQSQRVEVASTLVVGGELTGTRRLESRSETKTYRFRRPHAHLPMLITHTSGTTGLPKLVVHSAFTMRARYRPQALGALVLVRRRETVAVQVSFVHSRLVTAMAIVLRRGMPLVMLRNRPPVEFSDLLVRTHPGVVEAQPNSLVEWEQLATDTRAPLANLKLLSTTFDAIHPRTARVLLDASRRRNPLHVQLYGQSEVGPVAGRIASRRHADRGDWRSVGFAFPGMTAIRVVGGDNAGQVGHIEVRTDGHALSYLGEDERFESQSNRGWWRMGDMGQQTRSRQVYLTDREVDQIDGVNSTLEIEDLLMKRLGSLLEVVVLPDAQGRPTPIVVTKNGMAIDLRLWQQVTSDLPPLRDPIQMSMNEVPRTATKKVQRLALARQLFDCEPA